MSNLGGYQTMTRLAKKCGGPTCFIGLTMLSGFVIIRAGEAGVKEIIKLSKEGSKRRDNNIGETFEVTVDGKDSSGVEFRVGETYKVLESDRDAILIEKLGDPNNPYVVSGEFLSSISAFKQYK